MCLKSHTQVLGLCFFVFVRFCSFNVVFVGSYVLSSFAARSYCLTFCEYPRWHVHRNVEFPIFTLRVSSRASSFVVSKTSTPPYSPRFSQHIPHASSLPHQAALSRVIIEQFCKTPCAHVYDPHFRYLVYSIFTEIVIMVLICYAPGTFYLTHVIFFATQLLFRLGIQNVFGTAGLALHMLSYRKYVFILECLKMTCCTCVRY